MESKTRSYTEGDMNGALEYITVLKDEIIVLRGILNEHHIIKPKTALKDIDV